MEKDEDDIIKDILSDNTCLSTICDILIVDLSECGDTPVFLLEQSILTLNESPEETLILTESVISLSSDKLYAFPFKDVPSCWRRLYVDASVIRALAQRRLGLSSVITLDMALIMAGGQGRQKTIHKLLEDKTPQHPDCAAKVPVRFSITPPQIKLQHPIPRVNTPSLEWFQNHMDNKHTPLILTGTLSHWNALKTWPSPQYWLAQTINGTRLIPIELGESYVSSEWTQTLVPFSYFLHHHLLPSFSSTTALPCGYLAQHNLFAQIPSLRRDISVPEYCFCVPPVTPPDEPLVAYAATEGGDVIENIWLGPGGTRSPLHNDPYENVFAQVVGYKYFRLYAPRETHKLYPRGVEGGIQMGNTSQVNRPCCRGVGS